MRQKPGVRGRAEPPTEVCNERPGKPHASPGRGRDGRPPGQQAGGRGGGRAGAPASGDGRTASTGPTRGKRVATGGQGQTRGARDQHTLAQASKRAGFVLCHAGRRRRVRAMAPGSQLFDAFRTKKKATVIFSWVPVGGRLGAARIAEGRTAPSGAKPGQEGEFGCAGGRGSRSGGRRRPARREGKPPREGKEHRGGGAKSR